MSLQMPPGGREQVDYIYSDLDWIDEHADDKPDIVRKLTRQIRQRLREEIEPRMRRAAPGLEKQVKELEQRTKALEDQMELLKAQQFRKTGNDR
jgi:DNA-binding transcriptional regulator GbsR (MarR family)